MTFNQVLVAVVGAGGGGALITLAIVRAFGEKWLDSKFAGRLQDLRHEHERQMESSRLESSRILDRSTRLAEREFDVSAEAWALVFEVYVKTLSALPGFRRYPDLSSASDEVVRKIVEGNGFDQLETDQLLSKAPADRNSYYSERKQAHELWAAKKAVSDASNYLAKKALFLEMDLHERLTEFVDEAWRALLDRELIQEMRGDGPLPEGIRRDDEQFRSAGEKKIKALEQFVRARFWGQPTESKPQ
jgi:hypothetical protein